MFIPEELLANMKFKNLTSTSHWFPEDIQISMALLDWKHLFRDFYDLACEVFRSCSVVILTSTIPVKAKNASMGGLVPILMKFHEISALCEGNWCFFCIKGQDQVVSIPTTHVRVPKNPSPNSSSTFVLYTSCRRIEESTLFLCPLVFSSW